MVPTKYDEVSGKPMWKDEGADTWNFFSSVIDLGTATTFDIKVLAPNVDYTQLTVDNFYFRSASGSASSNDLGANAKANASTSTTKSYNAQTGILTCGQYVYAQAYSSKNHTSTSGNSTSALNVFLIV